MESGFYKLDINNLKVLLVDTKSLGTVLNNNFGKKLLHAKLVSKLTGIETKVISKSILTRKSQYYSDKQNILILIRWFWHNT